MPLTLVVIIAALIVSLLRGGRFRRLAHAPIRHSWLLAVGIALQVGVDITAARGLGPGILSTAVLVGSQLLVVAWVVANRFRPGMPLILLGLLMNLAVITANGAMPVDPEAIVAAGGSELAIPLGKHQLLTESTRLAFLADIYGIAPLRTVVSAGDIVLAAGLVSLVHDLMTYRPPHVRRGGRRRQDPAIRTQNDSDGSHAMEVSAGGRTPARDRDGGGSAAADAAPPATAHADGARAERR